MRGKWLCFQCHKSHNHQHAVCPDCQGELYHVGIYFKPPKKSKDKEWEAVEMLYRAGISFGHGIDVWQRLPIYDAPAGKKLDRWQIEQALYTRQEVIRAIDHKYLGGYLPQHPRDVQEFLARLAVLCIKIGAEIFEIHDLLGKPCPDVDPMILEQILMVLAKSTEDE